MTNNKFLFVRRPWIWLKRFRKRRGYGVHSPWAFSLIDGVILERGRYYAYDSLNKLHPWPVRLLKLYPLQCRRLLFRLANWVHPSSVLIIGDAPIETAYIRAAVPEAEIKEVQEVQEVQGVQKTDFLKIISGFGGCNAAIYVSKKGPTPKPSREMMWKTTHSIVITPQKVVLDNDVIVTNEMLPIKEERKDGILTFLYKTKINNYPKFYKMDALARLGFVATELLLQKERKTEGELNRQDRAVIFFNQSSSEHADKVFLSSISDPENFFPSPSAFVYTLPNIVNGEIAIRNNYRGETAFYILPKKDDDIIRMITQATLLDGYHKSIITGWLEYKSESDFLAELTIVIGYRL